MSSLFRLAALAAIWLLACVGNEAHLERDGVRVWLRAEPFSLEIENAHGVVLRADPGALLATRDTPEYAGQLLAGWDGYRKNEEPWTGTNAGRMTRIERDGAEAELRVANGELGVFELSLSERRVRMVWRVRSKRFNRASVRFTTAEDEHFFGLGERFTAVDHRGFSLYSWAEEGGLGGGETPQPGAMLPIPNGPSMTYFPVPFVHSTRGYSLLADTTWRTELALASEAPDALRVSVDTLELPMVIYTAATPRERLDDYTADTGRPMVPAPWVFGPRRRIGSRSLVDGMPEHIVHRERQMPLTGIDDAVHFLPDASQLGREEELLAWTTEAHRYGYKVMAYNNPYVAAATESVASDYEYGRANGLLEKQPNGDPATTTFISGRLHDLSAIDLTTAPGVAWFQSLLMRTLDLGYDGWMHDFGEYTARDSVMNDGRSGAEVHNLFPVLSAAAAHAMLEEVRPNDYLFFVRSGYVGTQAVAPAVWGGDSEATFDDTQGLPSAVRAGLNLGLVGVPHYGSDVTGFKCIGTDAPRDKEIFIRWIEFGAVSPIMMDQNACANPIQRQTKWRLWNDLETQDAWRRLASLHTRLAPYLRTASVEAHQTGMPIMRHPFLTHPDEHEGWAVEDSYFFGPSLYAAPVVRRGLVRRALWLPSGRYVDWNDKRVYAGPSTVEVDAPLGQLPLFLVENALVPLLDAEVQTLAPAAEPGVVTEADRADVLDVIVALAPGGAAEMTLPDGTVLRARRSSEAAPSELSSVEPDVLALCERCAAPAMQEGDVSRLRFNTALAPSTSERHEDVEVSSEGGPARRLRWDVWRTP